jgi:hypothetical protein
MATADAEAEADADAEAEADVARVGEGCKAGDYLF